MLTHIDRLNAAVGAFVVWRGIESIPSIPQSRQMGSINVSRVTNVTNVIERNCR